MTNGSSRTRWVYGSLCGLAAIASVLGLGCATSSHKTVRTYDYSNETRSVRPASRSEAQDDDDEPSDGEWHMVSPGEMVVDPQRK